MKFFTGFWDSIFGKKIIIEVPGPNGQIIKRKVTQRWFEKMKSTGRIKEIKEGMVRVHMINPVSGYSIEHWIVGKDVDVETVNKFRDLKTGDLYAMTAFENGQPKIRVLKKDFWEKTKKLMDSV